MRRCAAASRAFSQPSSAGAGRSSASRRATAAARASTVSSSRPRRRVGSAVTTEPVRPPSSRPPEPVDLDARLAHLVEDRRERSGRPQVLQETDTDPDLLRPDQHAVRPQ